MFRAAYVRSHFSSTEVGIRTQRGTIRSCLHSSRQMEGGCTRVEGLSASSHCQRWSAMFAAGTRGAIALVCIWMSRNRRETMQTRSSHIHGMRAYIKFLVATEIRQLLSDIAREAVASLMWGTR
jgi:hypothetical protein